MEGKIIGMLEQIMSKLDEHGRKLDEHNSKLDEHNRKLDEHSDRLNEQGQLLSALRTGQEFLKAELEGIKRLSENEFGKLNRKMEDFTVQFELLRDETWKNKSDIQRIKKTMGME